MAIILKVGQTVLRILQFCCSGIVLGVFSYFLAVQSRDNLDMPNWVKAVEGMSGGAALYGVFAILLTLCLGGIAFFGILAVILDVLFAGCFAAIAYYTRNGASSCSGDLVTPLGTGPDNQDAPGAYTYGYICRLETAVFAVSIANILLFLVTALVQIGLVRAHKKEKRFGPSPANNYTAGAGRKPFWSRNRKVHNTRDAELATAGPGAVRPSHETGMTGNTLTGAGYAEPKYGDMGYGHKHAATNY